MAVCDDKALYATKKRAYRAANRVRKRLYDWYGAVHPVGVYKCISGHSGWHLGHPPGWKEEQLSHG